MINKTPLKVTPKQDFPWKDKDRALIPTDLINCSKAKILNIKTWLDRSELLLLRTLLAASAVPQVFSNVLFCLKGISGYF